MSDHARNALALVEMDHTDWMHEAILGALQTVEPQLIYQMLGFTLSPGQARMMRVLSNPVGQIRTREELLARCWGANATEVAQRAVDAGIKNLRQSTYRYGVRFEALSGIGYRVTNIGQMTVDWPSAISQFNEAAKNDPFNGAVHPNLRPEKVVKPMLEEHIEYAVCDYAKSLGWIVRKCEFVGQRGCPDRFFWGPNGRFLMIEFKRPDGALSYHQKKFKVKVGDRGHEVHVVSDIEAGKALIDGP